MDYIGWLTPKAELIKCNQYGHLDTARCLVKEFGYPINDRPFDDILLDNGWIRISMQTFYDKGYMIWLPKHITAYQQDFLDDMLDHVYDKLCKVAKEVLEMRGVA